LRTGSQARKIRPDEWTISMQCSYDLIIYVNTLGNGECFARRKATHHRYLSKRDMLAPDYSSTTVYTIHGLTTLSLAVTTYHQDRKVTYQNHRKPADRNAPPYLPAISAVLVVSHEHDGAGILPAGARCLLGVVDQTVLWFMLVDFALGVFVPGVGTLAGVDVLRGCV